MKTCEDCEMNQLCVLRNGVWSGLRSMVAHETVKEEDVDWGAWIFSLAEYCGHYKGDEG